MELVYMICSLTTAGLCEEHRAAVYSPSPMACVIGAQAELAQLARVGWHVANWRCDALATAGVPDGATIVVMSD